MNRDALINSTHLIITADDFGLSNETTFAIAEAFGRGLITHASVTPNMPGFDCGPRLGFVNRAYKSWLNADLRRAGLASTRWYGSLDDFRRLRESGVPDSRLDNIELNIHPIFRNDVLVDLAYPDRPLEELLVAAGLPRILGNTGGRLHETAP